MCRGHMLLMILMATKLLEHFTKKYCKKKKKIKKSLELKMQSREKTINYILNGKAMRTCLIAG